MRSKSLELMNKICKYAEQYYLQNSHSPSTSNIANALGISRTTAYRYLLAMDDNGMIEYDGQEIHTAVTKKLSKDTTQMAIVGSVSCGLPEYEEENVEDDLELIAVITAAIAASEGTSTDGLVVRSIRKVNNRRK